LIITRAKATDEQICRPIYATLNTGCLSSSIRSWIDENNVLLK